MLKCSYAHIVKKYPVWVYAHIFISSKLNKYSFIKSKMKIQYIFILFLFSKKIKGHQAFHLFQLLFSCRGS